MEEFFASYPHVTSYRPTHCHIVFSMLPFAHTRRRADITIWSFPLYYFTVPGALKNLIDRQLPMNLPLLMVMLLGILLVFGVVSFVIWRLHTRESENLNRKLREYQQAYGVKANRGCSFWTGRE